MSVWERRKNSVPEPDPYFMSPKEVEDLLKILEKENYNEAVRQEQSGI